MLAVLELEWIGQDLDKLMCRVGLKNIRKPWVALILKSETYGYDREFLIGKLDYSRANSKGSRGVYLVYYLREGGVYEVFSFSSWKSQTRSFVTVVDGDVVEINKDEVDSIISCAGG